jgi:hypothetical protein
VHVNKIKIGFFSVTEIDGDPEEYVAWHQLDHMPEQFRVPGLSWGQRYFASPGCVAASAYREGPMRNACHVQNYLFEAYEPVMTEFSALGRALDGQGRYLRGPVVHVQAPFQLMAAFAAPRVLVAAEAVAFRANTGVYLVVENVPDADAAAEWRTRQHADHLPSMLAVPGVVGIWAYAAQGNPDADTGPYGIPASTKQIMVVYLDDDPIEVSNALRAHLERRWDGAPVQPLLAGAFRSFFPPPERFCRLDDPSY